MMVGSRRYGVPVMVFTLNSTLATCFLYMDIACPLVKKSPQSVAFVVQLVYAHLLRRSTRASVHRSLHRSTHACGAHARQ